MSQTNKNVLVRIFIICFFIIFTSANTAFSEEKPILLKVPSSFKLALPGIGTSITWIAERIEAASGGSLKMKLYEPGELVDAFEVLDVVSAGTTNAGFSGAGYWGERIPGAHFFATVPFGPEAPEYIAWLWYGNGMKLYQEMYDRAGLNVKPLICAIVSPETSGWFSKPINTPEDIKGLKMRFLGYGGKVMKKLGASILMLPPGEIFPAFQKGAIDAAEFSTPAIDRLIGFHKVAKYNYFPGWHQQATVLELLINKDVHNSMSDHQKMVLEVITRAAVADCVAFSESAQGPIIRENLEKYGVRNMTWSPEMLALFKKTWLGIIAEETAKDEFVRKVWEDISAFREDYAHWNKLGFLPRR